MIRRVGSSRRDLRGFPQEVRRDIGTALDAAQLGEMDPGAKPLKGFHGARVIEIRAHYRGDTYRAVYTVGFGDVIHVLHAFQKKATRGVATPKREIEAIKARLRQAEEIHQMMAGK
ncbi:MAG: type II toxin-antitoxin system RelE/ParE family toxin [Geminicoccaceae bacterium]